METDRHSLSGIWWAAMLASERAKRALCSVAWKTSQYGRIWEYLRRDFDVEARFETIEDKVSRPAVPGGFGRCGLQPVWCWPNRADE